MNSNLSLTSVGDYCIDEIIHLLEAVAKCVYSTIFSVIYSVIYSATKPWRLRFVEKLSQIHEKILFLADFLGSAACLTESGFMDCKEKFSLHSKAPAILQDCRGGASEFSQKLAFHRIVNL